MRRNKKKQKRTPSVKDLKKRELKAVELKYSGRDSKEIAEETGYSENYVRKLFMKRGRLEKACFEYVQVKYEENCVKIWNEIQNDL